MGRSGFRMEEFKLSVKGIRKTRTRGEKSTYIIMWRVKYEGSRYITLPDKQKGEY